ncbi:MAG: LCP family protein, partial [Lachnospiraceae bacterium]|nr:LCP family protein [Lachnospiraceae bacterium]
MYGINVSMETLEMFYDTELDYFFRINFSGFEDVIDALGGVTVNSPKAFTSLHGKYKFVKGPNEMDGHKALCFVRERYAFATGDDQRGKNQMALIQAIADKAISPAFLMNFQSLMDSIDGTFETSMSYKQITSLVKMQLDEGGQWTIASYAVSGTGDKLPVYSMSSIPYVTVPNYETVDKAKALIKMVRDGYIVSDDVIANWGKEQPSTSADAAQ